MSKFLFWFDDAYGQERMFTFDGTEAEAIRRAKELCNDGVECLTVESYETEQVVFDQREYETSFEVDESAYACIPFWG